MKELSRKEIMPLNVGPCDTLHVTYTDPIGTKYQLDAIQFDGYKTIDTIAFYKVEDEIGFKDGIAAVMGEQAK